MKAVSTTLIGLLLFVPTAHANLIINGDFSLGNTGFLSDYRYTTGLNTSEGVYAVATDPQMMHPDATSYGDHTTGTGNMLVANGATSGNKTVWEQAVSISANSDYIFAGWAASWGHYGDGIDTSPARLLLFANGLQLGSEFTVEQVNGLWTDFQYGFNSGSSTSVVLKVVNANLSSAPNDFSLDDISLKLASAGGTVPEPSTLALLALGLAGLGHWRRKQSTLTSG